MFGHIWCVCHLGLCFISWASSSTFHILICYFHGNPVLQGLQQIQVLVSFRERERETGRELEKESKERERVIE